MPRGALSDCHGLPSAGFEPTLAEPPCPHVVDRYGLGNAKRSLRFARRIVEKYSQGLALMVLTWQPHIVRYMTTCFAAPVSLSFGGVLSFCFFLRTVFSGLVSTLCPALRLSIGCLRANLYWLGDGAP